MTINTPTFNVREFELRGQASPYLTESQSNAVSDVESRVNGQLDWLGQLLGWSTPNYWSNLVNSVDQKRQLLGGFGGVYNSFTLPRVLEVRNWSNQIVIEKTEGISEGQVCYLGDKTATIRAMSEKGETLVLDLADLSNEFFEGFSLNEQLKVDSAANRPQPFVRSTPGISSDTAFSCKADGSTLVLYPVWDTAQKNPYKYNILIPGSRYYFDQPVYFSVSDSPFSPAVETKYDTVRELWFFDLPQNISITGWLVWSYSDPNAILDVSCSVTLFNWVDPSDWNNVDTLQNFTGVWGNKGGALPFNFCFDSLSLHGFDECNSLYLSPIERTIQFNTLVNLVYYGQTPSGLQPPGPPGRVTPGSAWWNPGSGAFSIFPPLVITTGAWLEVSYRDDPEPRPRANYVYNTVADFSADIANIPESSTVLIIDVTGLQADGGTYQVQGITSPLVASGEVYLYRTSSEILFTVSEFIFLDVAEFSSNAIFLPIGTRVRLVDPTGLKPEESGFYAVDNLEYEILANQAAEVILTKQYSLLQWALSPATILRFIANTKLYDGVGDPKQGEMWWDFANPDPTTRAASIWYQSAWVQINSWPIVGSAPGVVDYAAVGIYLDGKLIAPDSIIVTPDYTFVYTVNATGGFDFTYNPISLKGKTKLPTILAADSLTSAYRVDISPYVFSGLQYYMSPNVLDTEVPLRTWKESSLQVVSGPTRLKNKVYQNPLLADVNSGPCDNWQRIFFRLPPSYQRNGTQWSQVEMIAQDFTYFGSPLSTERAASPPVARAPKLYDELTLYPPPVPYVGVIYDEPYLYSNVGLSYNIPIESDYDNSTIFPAFDDVRDSFDEAFLSQYNPLHNRRADVSSPLLEGYGDWEGFYMVGLLTSALSGYVDQDVSDRLVITIPPPVWDASIYKYPPLTAGPPESFKVDMNNFKVGYAYFAADLSAAEDGFFDVQQDISWRDPNISARTGYVLPG